LWWYQLKFDVCVYLLAFTNLVSKKYSQHHSSCNSLLCENWVYSGLDFEIFNRFGYKNNAFYFTLITKTLESCHCISSHRQTSKMENVDRPLQLAYICNMFLSFFKFLFHYKSLDTRHMIVTVNLLISQLTSPLPIVIFVDKSHQIKNTKWTHTMNTRLQISVSLTGHGDSRAEKFPIVHPCGRPSRYTRAYVCSSCS